MDGLMDERRCRGMDDREWDEKLSGEYLGVSKFKP